METQQKRRIAALFSDKRFLLALGGLLLATTLLLYRSATTESAVTSESNGMNAVLPPATGGAPPRSKLEEQAALLSSQRVPPDQDSPLRDRLGLPGLDALRRDSLRLPEGASTASLGPYLYPSGENLLHRNLPDRTALDWPDADAESGIPEPSGRAASPPPRARARFSSATGVNQRDPDGLVRPEASADSEAERRARLLSLLETYYREAGTRRTPASLNRPEVVAQLTNSGLTGSGYSSVTALEAGGATSFGRNGFFGLLSESQSEPTQLADSLGRGWRATVAGDQLVTNGGRVRLQLAEPVRVSGVELPAGTLLYGLGEFGTERVRIRITGLRAGSHLLPVQLTVYDMDGLEGLYVPRVEGGSEVRQVLAGTAGGISVPVRSANPAGAAAATVAQAGVTGLRSLLQRKSAQSKAHLKGNYHLLLR